MTYFLGVLLYMLGIAAGFFGIGNIIDMENLTILNVTMMLCMICALGFAGILLHLGANSTNQSSSKKSYLEDDED
ncbi:MAG: hypothetical protein J5620_01810 [Alphaproteobacteria bacterium]|nr:hypothetical protein [Alphaproteobacteria bacterium]